MKKNLKVFGTFLFLLTQGFLVFLYSCNHDDDNSLNNSDLTIINESVSGLNAGFASVSITPEIPDKWIDVNGDSEYKRRDGDTFTDGNGNDSFDPVWIAGFGNRRAANGIHDSLWARTMVIDDGHTRLAIVSLDIIGFMNNAVNDVRKLISADAGITYLVITSTHTHEAPDLLGLWGKNFFRSGVNKEYMEYVKGKVALSVMSAVENLRPVRLEVSQDSTGAAQFVEDSRTPYVLDPGLRMIRAIDNIDGKTLGTLITWGNHPETLWGKNLLITSDYPHYLREGIEKGIFRSDNLVMPGIGGITVFVNGSIGGLMTTSPGFGIKDPFSGEEFREPTFEKAKAQGTQLAILSLNAMSNPVEKIDSAAISLVVRTLRMPLKNKLFKLGKILGVLDRGTSGLKYMWTELAVFKIGDLSFSTFPGEVYPEIVNGGIESPEGNDLSIDPVEIPPIRDLMPGKYKFVIGLGNDEIGYIIPKSQWDAKKPFAYNRDKAPYGETNSIGPETAALLHSKLKEMLLELR